MTPERRELLDSIGATLHMRQYNRQAVSVQSGEVELSPTEFVFLTAWEFRRNVFCNGFDGFVSNTYGYLTDFLPIALAAVGAPRFSLLARLAWQDREETEYSYDDQFIDTLQEEDLDALLLAYAEKHRHELPEPSAWTLERYQKWENDRPRWIAERQRAAHRWASEGGGQPAIF